MKSHYARICIKKTSNLNESLKIKLYKKQGNYVVNLSRKAKKDYFQKHMPTAHLLKNFGNFANLSLLIKSQILTTKLCWS